MSYQALNLNCPGCGSPISTNQKQCNICRRPIVITSFSDIQSFSLLDLNRYISQNSAALSDNPNNDGLNMSQAMCKLKLKLYDDAFSFFKIAQNSFTNSEPFFYAAIALLKGKKAFLADKTTQIDKILEYINAAIQIEEESGVSKGIYYYFLAYIKYDFFERKSLNTSPDWKETFEIAKRNEVTQANVDQLAELLQVKLPECLCVSQ